MLEINGKTYELKYTVGRVRMIEDTLGISLMSTMVNANGMLSISQLCNFIAFGLKENGKDYVNFNKGMKIADELLEKKGYANLNVMVIEAVQRDCPFFFQAD